MLRSRNLSTAGLLKIVKQTSQWPDKTLRLLFTRIVSNHRLLGMKISYRSDFRDILGQHAPNSQDYPLKYAELSPAPGLDPNPEFVGRAQKITTSRPNISGLDYAAVWRPGKEPLGSFGECLVPSNSEIVFVMGDLTNHRKQSALASSLILHYVRAAVSMTSFTPMRLGHELNEIIWNSFKGEVSVSCFYAHFSAEYNTLRYINAGHRLPLLVRSDTDRIIKLDKGGPALGVSSSARYIDGSMRLKKGDRMLAVTAGVVERWASPHDIHAEAALIGILQRWARESAAEMANFIADDGKRETHGTRGQRIAITARVGATDAAAIRFSERKEFSSAVGA